MNNYKKNQINLERINTWENIYKHDKLRWGSVHSLLAGIALSYFNKINKNRILDLGCGYGRDSYLFSLNNMDVRGIESSTSALNLFYSIKKKNGNLKLKFINEDIFNFKKLNYSYNKTEIIYANYLFHLFTFEELDFFFNNIIRYINKGTYIFFNLISDCDNRYRGNNISNNEEGITWTFWNKDKIKDFFNRTNLKIIEIRQFKEIEFINNKPDIVDFYFCLCKST